MAKNSPKNKKKGSPEKGSKTSSPKKNDQKANQKPQEEEIIEITLPKGVMHEKLRHIYDESLVSDVNIVVGPNGTTKTFKLHKFLLVSESPVFEKLMKELDQFKIQIIKQDIEENWENLKLSRKEPEDQFNKIEEFVECGPPKTTESPKLKSSKKGSPNKKGSSKKSESPKKSNKSSPKIKKEKKNKKGSPEKKKKSPQKVIEKTVAVEEINLLVDLIIDESTVRIHDVHPDGFYRLMRYIYYDEIVFNGVIGTIRTLYAARKYLFYDLSKACVIYLENNVTLKHVLRLLKASFDFHEDRLQELCMELIRNDTFEVVSQQAFIYISKEMLQLILEQDILNIREIELFDRVSAWAESRCELINIPVTAQNQRIAMGPYTMSLIRFPTILSHEFATHIVENGILTNEEIIGIMSYYLTGIKPPVPYSFITRRRPYKHPEPDCEALSIVYSNTTDITFVETMRDNRFRYAISMDHLEDLPPTITHRNTFDPCLQTDSPIMALSDYPLHLNKALYRTTSLPGLLRANNYELQLIHHKLHHQNCRNLNKEHSYIENNMKDLTILKPVVQTKRRLRHWDFESQLMFNTIL